MRRKPFLTTTTFQRLSRSALLQQSQHLPRLEVKNKGAW
jgi:hypothetical protein